MRPLVMTLYILEWLFLVGSPVGFIIGTLVQPPNSEGHSGPGPDMAKLVIASFASLPFMALGGVLLIIGANVRHRSKLRPP